MADVKVSALTAISAGNVTAADLLYLVDVGDPTPDKKLTIATLRTALLGTAYTATDDLTIRNITGTGGTYLLGSGVIDANTTLTVGGGGGAPTAGRDAFIVINSPSSGSFLGRSGIVFQRNGSTNWQVNTERAPSGAMSANTALGFYNGSAYVMSLEPQGRLRIGVDANCEIALRNATSTLSMFSQTLTTMQIASFNNAVTDSAGLWLTANSFTFNYWNGSAYATWATLNANVFQFGNSNTNDDSTFLVGGGGGAPTANRVGIIRVNVASSGSFIGSALLRLHRNGGNGWDIGMDPTAPSGAKAANTDLGFNSNIAGGYVASLTTGGQFRTTGGLVALSASDIVNDGAAATNRGWKITTGNVLRWYLFGSNAAESGSNAGTGLIFARYDDSGTYLGDIMRATRATGAVQFPVGSLVVGNDPGGSVLFRVGGEATFSTGVDTDTTVSIAAGGAAPTANRTARLVINAPSGGSGIGNAFVTFSRASTTQWITGIDNDTSSGPKTANTNFLWFVQGVGYVAALTTAGQLRTAGGFFTDSTNGVNISVANGSSASVTLTQSGITAWVVRNVATTGALEFIESGRSDYRFSTFGSAIFGVSNTDANTSLSLGVGGGAPAANRVITLDLNAPSSGGFPGSAVVQYRRNSVNTIQAGLFASVTGAMSSSGDYSLSFAGSASAFAVTSAGQLRLNDGQLFGLGSTSSRLTVAIGVDSVLQVTRIGTGVIPIIDMFSARGTVASPTATQLNDVVGRVRAQGYGTSYQGRGYIDFVAGENWTGSANGMSMIFYATPVGGLLTRASMELRPSATTDDTDLLLYDVTAGTLKRVTRGATDSGGTGFRVLRVTN